MISASPLQSPTITACGRLRKLVMNLGLLPAHKQILGEGFARTCTIFGLLATRSVAGYRPDIWLTAVNSSRAADKRSK